MIYTDLAGRYFDWLYERVCGDWEPRGLSFHRLLTFLYNQNFTPSCELDGARAEDWSADIYRPELLEENEQWK